MRFDDWLTKERMTNPEFGEKAGWSAERVRKYRSGEREPGRDEMATIFHVTGGEVTPNDWVGVGPRTEGAVP